MPLLFPSPHVVLSRGGEDSRVKRRREQQRWQHQRMHTSRPVTNNSHAFENRRTTKKTRRIGRQILLTAAREGDETTSTTSFMDSMNIASRGDVVNVTSSGSSTRSRSSLSYVPEEEDGDDDEAMAFPERIYKEARGTNNKLSPRTPRQIDKKLTYFFRARKNVSFSARDDS